MRDESKRVKRLVRLTRLDTFMDCLMGSSIGWTIGSFIGGYLNMKFHPVTYTMQSAPWWINGVIMSIFATIAIIAGIIVKVIAWKQIYSRPKKVLDEEENEDKIED